MLGRLTRQSSTNSRRLFHRSVAAYLSSSSKNEQGPEAVPQQQRIKRRLDVAIVGLPNAGKSQLLNVLTGASVSAVSRKRHTTREGILGAKTIVSGAADTADNNNNNDVITTQLLFVDTPGFLQTGHAKMEGLDRDLMVSARREMVAVDYTVIVVDAARRLTGDVRASLVELIMQAVTAQGRIEDGVSGEDDDDENDSADTDSDSSDDSDDSEDEGSDKANDDATDSNDDGDDSDEEEEEAFLPHQKFAVVLNKVDLVHPKSYLLELAMEIGSIAQECLQYNPHASQEDQSDRPPLDQAVLLEIMPTFFYTSALKNEGVDDLLAFLVKKATLAKVFEVEPGQSTTMLPEELAEEIIREKIYRCLHKEVPYQIRQQNRLFRVIKDDDGKHALSIQQDLIVQNKSHQELVHGRGDQTLERIRESAERDMIKSFGCKVTLRLHVKLAKSKQRPWSIG